MADKCKAVGGGSLIHTLHVRPSRQVVAQSAYWPEWWFPAYDRVVRRLADQVACGILGGLPACPEALRVDLQPSGSLTFSVQLKGTTIDVVIWEFEGPEGPEPDAPGPNGGVRQRTADRLVLGLRGTGKDFSVAAFYDGLVPPLPVGRGGRLWPWTIRITTAARTDGDSTWHVTAATRVAAMPRTAPSKTSAEVSATGEGRTYLVSPCEGPASDAKAGLNIEMHPFQGGDATGEEIRRLSLFAERTLPFADPIIGAVIRERRSCAGNLSPGATSARLN